MESISSLRSNKSKVTIEFTVTYIYLLVFRSGIHKLLGIIANREDNDQTAIEEAVWSGLRGLSRPFYRHLVFEF